MLRERPRPQVDFKSRRNSERGTKEKGTAPWLFVQQQEWAEHSRWDEAAGKYLLIRL